MIRRDYILKIIEELMKAIATLLNKPGATVSERESDINACYSMLGFTADDCRTSEIEDILLKIAEEEEGYMMRVEGMADLLFADATVCDHSEKGRNDLLRKSLTLMQYADEKSGVFSFERNEKMDRIKEMIKE